MKLILKIIFFIILLAGLELSARFYFFIKDVYSWNKNKRYESSIYKDSPWAKQYFMEFDQLKKNYYPFYEWRRQGYAGKFINISDEGIRKTWNPKDTKKLNKVFIFGGSTVWGTGVRDNFTIASLLSKNINKNTESYSVTNFGEAGYVLTQEIILLITQLKKGNIPDYVIFYDGVNDVLAALQNREAGLIYNYNRWKMKLGLEPRIFNKLSEEALLTNSKFIYLFSYLNNVFKKNNMYDETALENLAYQIIKDYKKNMDLIERLSQAYGFKYSFFWQPVLFMVNPKTNEEITALAFKNKELERIYFYTYTLADRLNRPKFHNLSHLFDNKSGTYFIDYCHVGEKQNQIIADGIFEVIKNELKN
ncbi:MAG: hypothetical protein ABIH18_06965 [Candidatus Omnitrophota bacterium]